MGAEDGPVEGTWLDRAVLSCFGSKRSSGESKRGVRLLRFDGRAGAREHLPATRFKLWVESDRCDAMRPRELLDRPPAVADFFWSRLRHEPQEVMAAAYLPPGSFRTSVRHAWRGFLVLLHPQRTQRIGAKCLAYRPQAGAERGQEEERCDYGVEERIGVLDAVKLAA